MQPFIHKEGALNANKFAQLVESSGLKEMFNDDPMKSIEIFKLYNKFNWIDPDNSNEDAKLYANLIRMCIHFEIETISFMQVMGINPNEMFCKTVDKFMGQNTVDSLKIKFTTIPTSQFRLLSREISKDVYNYIRNDLQLPNLNWSF